MLSAIYIGEGKFIPVDTDITDSERMSLRIILYFLHHFTRKLQINQIRSSIAINTDDFSKRPNALASNEAFTIPFAPGAIGSFVQSATAQAQEVVTLVSTKGRFPVLVMVYSTVTGRFHSICPKLCVSLLEEIRGWATAAKVTISRKNMIDEICRMTENNAADCDIIAVSNGPGSFTGLRIGAATGKGLALALDKPMVAVPTLEAMAYNFYGDDRIICPVMDARRAHLYSGLYRFENGKLITVHEQCLISYGELAGILNEVKEKVVFVGDGIAAAKDYFKDNLTCNYTFSPAGLRTQRASSVALAAIDMANEGKTIGSDMLKPDYLRPSQAEREHSGKRA